MGSEEHWFLVLVPYLCMDRHITTWKRYPFWLSHPKGHSLKMEIKGVSQVITPSLTDDKRRVQSSSSVLHISYHIELSLESIQHRWVLSAKLNLRLCRQELSFKWEWIRIRKDECWLSWSNALTYWVRDTHVRSKLTSREKHVIMCVYKQGKWSDQGLVVSCFLEHVTGQ